MFVSFSQMLAGPATNAIVGLDDGQWLCCYCQKTCSSRTNARQHIRLVHLKEKKFACPFCGYKTGLKGNLTAHLKACKNKPQLLVPWSNC